MSRFTHYLYISWQTRRNLERHDSENTSGAHPESAENPPVGRLFEQGDFLTFHTICCGCYQFSLQQYNIYICVTPFTVLPPEVGLQKILSLLEAQDADVRIHAVKVVANLAAEGFISEIFIL